MPNADKNSKAEIQTYAIQTNQRSFHNAKAQTLIEQSILRKEGYLVSNGALVVSTGQHTGRSPHDKYIVKDETTSTKVNWGKINQSISQGQFEKIYQKIKVYLSKKDLFIQDLSVGATSTHRLKIRVITQFAWQSLFSQNLFIRLPWPKLDINPDFTVIACPVFRANPSVDGTCSGTFIIINFSEKLVLIGGTQYAGEIKKSIFSVMNFLLPQKEVLSMHCSANIGKSNDTALFFGLSGTGKTTLSSDPDRGLIGDDEHGWDNEGIFNLEGGCYAKTIRLNSKYEPLIWNASNRFGTVLENVSFDSETREVDFSDDSKTENTRAAYPLEYIPGYEKSGCGTHPTNIFFLTADAFGILPPLSKLSRDQAMYYFLSGYTSKLAGTERGLGTEPEATFSTCFGAPFLPLDPHIYAELLGKKIDTHGSKVWLVNTGWYGGKYGIGKRMDLPYTRALINAVLENSVSETGFRKESFFGFEIPISCPEVPQQLLDPQESWANKQEYRDQANILISKFQNNFQQFSGNVTTDIVNAGPILT
jgi:phosphoenolpyruvate carboxykinase (ATP)